MINIFFFLLHGYSIDKQLDYCFYDTDGKTILEDYCYKTYITRTFLDKFCLPEDINSERIAIESTVKGYFYTLRFIAHDIYSV